jgi:hypothetical protein
MVLREALVVEEVVGVRQVSRYMPVALKDITQVPHKIFQIHMQQETLPSMEVMVVQDKSAVLALPQ